jgi:2-dehydro-3-deoxyphosphogluconate aldolase/(4S)-4-hydroxy-2-oxoglutarate aldolase
VITSELAEIERIQLVPVVVIDDARQAVSLGRALAAGGIGCAEITLRTEAGLAAIEAIAGIPDFIVGAGTVTTADQVDRVADAGARFIVSPGIDEDVLERAAARGIAAIPGIATATEVQRAIRAGVDVVKLFPAGLLGGIDMISALAGPFPELRFLPSGGVGLGNAVEYLAHPAVLAVSGSWMVPRSLISAGDFAGIERLSAETTELVGRRA